MLDSDSDGQISSNAIDISSIPSELLEVLGPLFFEMEELSQALDLDEFIEAVGCLYETLSIPDKDKLLLKLGKREKSFKRDSGQNFMVSQI